MQTVAWLRAAAVVVLVSGCSVDREPALRVGATIRPVYEPMHLAQRMGEYDERKILLIDFSSSVEVMRAYRNGVVDVAALTADEALTVVAAEPDKHKLIVVAGFSDGADSIIAQPAFTEFKKLKGHRIGVEANALGGYVLTRALQNHGMTLSDVEPVPLSLDQQLAAFESGAVDAIVTFEPNRSSLLASGGIDVFSSRDIPGEVMDVIVTRSVLVAERRGALLHFIRGWFIGLDSLRGKLPDAGPIAAAHERIAPDTFAASLQGVQLADRDRNIQLFNAESGGIESMLGSLADRMREAGISAATLNSRSLYGRLLVE